MFESLWQTDIPSFAEAVKKGADLRCLDEEGLDLVTVAVACGFDMTEAALDAGADPNHKSCDGTTCLRAAVLKEDLPLLKLLISSGARVDAEQPSDGSTSLHVAAERGLSEYVELLVQNASKPCLDRFDYVARTPLICAVQNGHMEAAVILLSARADVNAHDESRIGDTALAFAVYSSNIEFVRLLLSAGADPTIRGHLADSPLDKARRRVDYAGKSIFELLSGHVKGKRLKG